MTQLTQEEIRDEVLSIFEDSEKDLASYVSQIEKIEDESIELFDRKVISIKNRLVADPNVSENDLQKAYLEEVELARKSIIKDVEEKINLLVKSQ